MTATRNAGQVKWNGAKIQRRCKSKITWATRLSNLVHFLLQNDLGGFTISFGSCFEASVSNVGRGFPSSSVIRSIGYDIIFSTKIITTSSSSNIVLRLNKTKRKTHTQKKSMHWGGWKVVLRAWMDWIKGICCERVILLKGLMSMN